MRFVVFFFVLSGMAGTVYSQSASTGKSEAEASDSTGRPLTFNGVVLDRLDLERLPVRTIQQALGTIQSAEWREGTGEVYVHGHLSDHLTYYWNGIPLGGSPHMPFDAIDRVELYSYHVPARLSGVAGVVNVETSDVRILSPRFLVSGVSSQRFDDTGYQQVSLSGAIPFGGRGGFVSGAFEATRNPLSSAMELPSLNAETRARLDTDPLQLLIMLGSSPQRVVDVPDFVAPGTTVDELEQAIGLSQGEYISHFDSSVRFIADDAFEYGDPTGYGEENLQGSISFEIPLTDELKFFGSASHRSGNEVPYLPTYSLFNANRGLYTDYNGSRFQAGANVFIGDLSLTLTGGTESNSLTTHNALFSAEIQDQFFYGSYDVPENTALLDARRFRINVDGIVESGPNGFQNDYETPIMGIAPVDYFRQEGKRSNFVGIEGAYKKRGHSLVVGVQTERDVSRLWVQRQMATSIIFRSQAFGYQSYDEDAAFGSFGDVLLYGYDNLGLQTTDSDFLPDSLTSNNLITTAPLVTNASSFYLSDKFEFRNIQIDAGIRANRYANNQKAAFDPFHLLPVRRVRDLDIEVPSQIGDDFTVYYFDADNGVAGYRDRDGNYYLVTGERTEPDPLNRPFGSPARPQFTSTSFTGSADEVLTDSRNHWTFEPRLHVSSSLANNLSASMFFNSLSQSQGDYMAASLHQYNQVVRAGVRIGNANLEPVVSNRYGIGLQYTGISNATVALTAFEVRTSGIGVLVTTADTNPRNYETYESSGRIALRGLSFEAEGSLGDFVSVSAGYTYQQDIELTDFTVSDHTLEKPFEFDRISESANIPFRAHNLRMKAVVSGPDNIVTRNGTVAVLVNHASGRRYTPRSVFDPYWQSFPGSIEGGVLTSTTNSVSRVDLRAEKGFEIKNAVSFSLYLWVMNVLAAQNEYTVYPTSGNANDDGWLETTDAQSHVSLLTALYGSRAGEAFADQYSAALRNPSYVGIPRQVRFGIKVSF